MPVLDRFALPGQVAVVTGATRGLGRGFATALGEAGASVVLVGRDEVAADEVLADLGGRGVEAIFVRADITAAADVEHILDGALERFGRVDVLVNNAGTCVHAPALEVTAEDWKSVMTTNVDALWTCSQVFGRHFIENGGGNIINIGSISALIVNRPQWQPGYNASKAAVHQLTKSLAAEWAPHGVRVNALAPGYIKTDMAPVDDPRVPPDVDRGRPDAALRDGGRARTGRGLPGQQRVLVHDRQRAGGGRRLHRLLSLRQAFPSRREPRLLTGGRSPSSLASPGAGLRPTAAPLRARPVWASPRALLQCVPGPSSRARGGR